jgi:hypothetical protein
MHNSIPILLKLEKSSDLTVRESAALSLQYIIDTDPHTYNGIINSYRYPQKFNQKYKYDSTKQTYSATIHRSRESNSADTSSSAEGLFREFEFETDSESSSSAASNNNAAAEESSSGGAANAGSASFPSDLQSLHRSSRGLFYRIRSAANNTNSANRTTSEDLFELLRRIHAEEAQRGDNSSQVRRVRRRS